MLKKVALMALVGTAGAAGAGAMPAEPFASIDGGTVAVSDWIGQPVLVVNTASLCGYTPQYDALQTVFDRYRDRGLVVLAVPSNDFRQELASAAEVQEFCSTNFHLTMPMTDITPVKGAKAHPFYQWVKAESGFAPAWNFNKVLIDRQGRVAGTWPSGVKPDSAEMVQAIEAALK